MADKWFKPGQEVWLVCIIDPNTPDTMSIQPQAELPLKVAVIKATVVGVFEHHYVLGERQSFLGAGRWPASSVFDNSEAAEQEAETRRRQRADDELKRQKAEGDSVQVS